MMSDYVNSKLNIFNYFVFVLNMQQVIVAENGSWLSLSPWSS